MSETKKDYWNSDEHLFSAINKYYPGGIKKLQEDLQNFLKKEKRDNILRSRILYVAEVPQTDQRVSLESLAHLRRVSVSTLGYFSAFTIKYLNRQN